MAGPGSFYHGVTVTLIENSARTIALPSSSIIGLVATYSPGAALAAPNQPVLVTSLTEGVAKFGVGSEVAKRLKDIYTQSAAVVVVVGVPATKDVGGVATPLTDNELTSAVIGGITASGQRTDLQALLDAKSVTNQTPRLIMAPGHSRTQAVASAMEAVATKLRAIAIADGPSTNDEAALAYAAEFGSKRIYLVDPGLKVFDTDLSAEVVIP